MSQSIMTTRTSFYKTRGRALFKGGGNITGLLLRPRITLYYARYKKRISQVTLRDSLIDYYKLFIKGNGFKLDLYQVYKLNLLL